MKIALAYIRVSSDGQQDNSSLESQRKAIVAYCVANGYIIEEVFSDVDSGSREARVGLMALRQRITEKNFSAVIVAKVDRFTRDLLLGETVRREIERNHGVLVSVAEHLDSSTPTGVFITQVLQAFAQLDKANILTKMVQGKKSTVETKGTFAGGTLPYGYKACGTVGEAAIDESEGEVIRQIFELKKKNLSIYKISAILNEKGVKARNGKDIYPMMVQRILKRHDVYESRKPFNFNFTLKEGTKARQPKIL